MSLVSRSAEKHGFNALIADEVKGYFSKRQSKGRMSQDR